MASEEQIKKDVKDYIEGNGGKYSSWYVGIADNPRERLFDGHGVKEEGDLWIYRTAESSTEARRIEKYFVEQLGTDGGTGGGDEKTKAVYAYLKNSHTSP